MEESKIIDTLETYHTADEVKTWCAKLGIKLDYASVYHPQTNGQVERANGLIMNGQVEWANGLIFKCIHLTIIGGFFNEAYY